MSPINRTAIVLLGGILAGCAIHPLPEHVTGVKTSQIVHRNRCEARAALLGAEQRLKDHHNKQAVKTLQKIGIVLSYTLDMTENDGLTANATFERVLTNSTTSINPMAGDVLKRENVRTFTVTDNYDTLASMQQCDTEPVGPNYQYPIVGTIGIDEVIRSFLTMALHEDLSAAGANPLPNPSVSIAGPPAMVETLTFTTTLTAGVTPTIMLTPVGTALQLTNASLGVTASRIDAHEVIIGLGLPTVLPPPAMISRQGAIRRFVPYSAVAGGAISSSRNRTPLLINTSVPVGTGASSGIAVALEAVNNQIIRFQVLPRTVIAVP